MIELPPDIETEIHTSRLDLSPLRAEDASEMWEVLADASLYTFTGDAPPPSPDWLCERYRLLESRRSPDGHELWLNWVVRERAGAATIGYVQASVSAKAADLAWVIGTAWQGRGYASEAAQAMTDWVGERFPDVTFTASIHPDHVSSAGVALRLGLSATDTLADDETLWRGGACRHVTPEALDARPVAE